MGTVEIFEAVVAGGIRDTHFFNGRLLTAGDLRTTQDAVVARDRQLAQAIGAGVAHGLEVSIVDPGRPGTSGRPTLRVGGGLALSRRGDALTLPEAVDVALIREPEVRRAAAGEFAICPPPRPVVSLVNFGLYVLTVGPASWYEGLAPMTELQSEGIGSSCGRRYEVDGVKFGLTRVDLGATLPLDDVGVSSPPAELTLREEITQLAFELEAQLGQLLSGLPIFGLAAEVERKLSRLRNCAAHVCFGTEERLAFVSNPLQAGSRAAFGALDALFDAGTLRDAEVPLALMYWGVRGVEFVDMWAVRRPLLPAPPSARWAPFASERLAIDGMAMALQFQQQVEDLRGKVTLQSVRAVDLFRYLPPVALLAEAAGTAPGVDVARFFETRIKRQPVFIEGPRLSAVLANGFRYPAIDVGGEELIWLYRVRENVLAVGGGGTTPASCLVFANGYTPYAGAGQYDLSHWNYGNYA